MSFGDLEKVSKPTESLPAPSSSTTEVSPEVPELQKQQQQQQPPRQTAKQEAKLKYEELKKHYREPTKIRQFIYDLVLWTFSVIFDCFFREIRPRGAYKMPKSGPIIFVAAPHANQFIDPIVLMGQVKKETGRRISFLIAEKSHNRKFIGLVSRAEMAVPVKRAQDNLKTKKGTVRMDPENELRIIGKDTTFTKDCEARGLLALPKSLGTGEIGDIISDTELYLKKPFRFSSPSTSEKAKQLLKEGSVYKTAPKIDQSEVYCQVFEHLAHGHCIGLFSEGGSHDRPDLLPLKAGVAIMALGAMDANPNCNVKIVPCGMNYFHPHRFRSRAVVEFGTPIEIDRDLIKKYADPKSSKDAIRELLDTITKGLKSVTVTCPDYESLACVQAATRLYSNNLSSKLSIGTVVEMNRRLLQGYLYYKDDPEIQSLKKDILEYNVILKSLKIPDHLVESTKTRSRLIVLASFLSAAFKLVILCTLALPGVILFSPVFFATKQISERKRKEALAGSTVKIQARDVIATWKILVSMGLAPLLYIFYSVMGILILQRYYPGIGEMSKIKAFLTFYLFSIMITYSALIFGDRGMDLFKSIRPLWLLLANKGGFTILKQKREKLSMEITEAVNKLGPQLFPDFNLIEYDKKQELKKLRRQERQKRHAEKLEQGLDSEDEFEEMKTQQLRQRRAAKKQLDTAKIPEGGVTLKLTSSVPIMQNDHEYTSSAGLSSTSDNEFLSTSSESEFENGDTIKIKDEKLNLIKDQIIRDNREKQL